MEASTWGRRIAAATACLFVLGMATPAPAQSVDTYGPGIARAVSKAKSPRDLRGVWVQRIWTARLVPNPPYKPEVAAARAQPPRPQDSRMARCLPDAWPNAGFNSPYPIEIFQLPEVTLIYYEVPAVLRRIWTDGRKLPVDGEPTWLGDSVGHWDGDVFVVETANIKANDGNPSPVHTTERYHMGKGGKQLDIEIVIDDPRIYTQPLKASRTFYLTDDHILEYSCEENNRNNPDAPGPMNMTEGPPAVDVFDGILTDRNVDRYMPELGKKSAK